MRRYLFIIGAVIIGRIFYIVLLYTYIWCVDGFPGTFWWTGVVDLTWSILYIVITLTSDDIHLKDLFLPKWEGKVFRMSGFCDNCRNLLDKEIPGLLAAAFYVYRIID
jgi:hypothetical protein